MADRVSPGPIRSNQVPREAVCVHTKKVYDSCRDKECPVSYTHLAYELFKRTNIPTVREVRK